MSGELTASSGSKMYLVERWPGQCQVGQDGWCRRARGSERDRKPSCFTDVFQVIK